MPFDIDLTGVWVGQPGLLAPIPNAVGELSSDAERASSVQTAINGARTVQYAPLVRRAWKVSAPRLTPVERGTIEGLYRMGGYPWALAMIDGWRHNLLTPEASMFAGGGGTVAGPVQLPPDKLGRIPAMIAPNRMVLSSYSWVTIGQALVVPGTPVTASAWMKNFQANAAVVSLSFRDATGTQLSEQSTYRNATDWARVAATATPPAGTVWAALSVAGGEVAAPAVTWTPEVTEWTIGTGCHLVMPSPPSFTVDPKSVGVRWDMSMTLTELG